MFFQSDEKKPNMELTYFSRRNVASEDSGGRKITSEANFER